MVGLRRDGEEMEEGRMGSESGPSEVPSKFSVVVAPSSRSRRTNRRL